MYQQRQQGQFDAAVARNNAFLARQQAKIAAQQGAEAASQIMAEGRATASGAVAQLAASGVDTTVGSAAGIEAQSIVNAQRAADAERANAMRRAWGLENEARDLDVQRKMIRRGTTLGMVGTGLSGAGSIAASSGNFYEAYNRKYGSKP